MNDFQDKANFIWQVADDILFGTFMYNEFRDVVLPFVVMRRLDNIHEDSKEAVLFDVREIRTGIDFFQDEEAKRIGLYGDA